MSEICGFNKAWIGACQHTVEKKGDKCPEHAPMKCCSCGEPATRDCGHTGIQFVCGAPLCDGCDHGAPEKGKEGWFNLGGGHHKKELCKEQWEKRWAEHG